MSSLLRDDRLNPLPVAIVIPHAGLEIPPELQGRVRLTPEQIFNESDAYTDLIFGLEGAVRTIVRFPFARALVDVNRIVDPTVHRPGDGIVKRRTSYGDEVYLPGSEPDSALEHLLIEKYWIPWHNELAPLSRDPEIKLVIDAHSMAAIGPDHYDDPGQVRPSVALCNGGHVDGGIHPDGRPLSAPQDLLIRLSEALPKHLPTFPTLAPTAAPIAMNTPYRGGADTLLHGGRLVPWVMLEVNRGLYIGKQHANSPIAPPDEVRIHRLRTGIINALKEIFAPRSD